MYVLSQPIQEGKTRLVYSPCGCSERLAVAFGCRVSREETFEAQLLQRNVVRRAEGGNSGKELQDEIVFDKFDCEERCLPGLPIRQVPGARYIRVGKQLVE